MPKTIIIAHDNFLNRFLFRKFVNMPGVETAFFTERKNPWVSLLKTVRMALGNPRGFMSRAILPPGMRKALRQAQPGDTILFWSLENKKYVSICARESHAGRKVSWLWNPMRRLHRKPDAPRKYMEAMNRVGVEVQTFDPDDARLLGARLRPQVHSIDTAITPAKTGAGVFFVGQLKNRGPVLADVEKMLTRAGIECDFHLCIYEGEKQKTAVPENLKPYFHDSMLAYDDVLKRTAQSAAVLDITQNGQSGITLRSLEALFYGRKLITDNPHIKQQDFYRPANVWILNDPDEPRTLAQFMAQPFEPVPQAVIENHLIGNWLKGL